MSIDMTYVIVIELGFKKEADFASSKMHSVTSPTKMIYLQVDQPFQVIKETRIDIS